MRLKDILEEDLGEEGLVRGDVSRRGFFKSFTTFYVLSSFPLLNGCKTIVITEPSSKNPQNPTNPNNPPSQAYSSLTGLWDLSVREGFGNDTFRGSLSVSDLSIIQTNQLKEGYSSDVYRLIGSFSGFNLVFQRRSNGTLYPLYQNASGSIINGGVNINIASHNLEFDLATTNYHLRGVSPDYKSMWGDITVKIDMTSLYRTNDGIITLTGMWDAVRKN